MTATAREDLEEMLRRSGLSLSPSQVGQLLEGCALVAPMLQRIRMPNRDDSGAPGQIFRAGAYALRPRETDAA